MAALNYARMPLVFTESGKFAAKPFEDTYIPVTESGCWITLHCWNKDGYGRTGKFPRLAHRLSYQRRFGPIPNGMLVCHKCDTPACVNPDHLFLGTDRQNFEDCLRKGRVKRARGTKNGSAVLSESCVLSIRASSKSEYELASEYGVTPATIYKVRTGRTWKHVGGVL